MLDIRYIRENPQKVQTAATQKGYTVDVSHLLSLDEQKRELQTKAESLRRERNELAASLKNSKPTEAQISRGKDLKTELAEVEDHLRVAEEEFIKLLKEVPNMPMEEVPVGPTEDENVVVRTIGEQPVFTFEPKNHWDIAQARGWIDKERAAKVAGARFAYVMGDLVKLQMALVQFTIDQLTDEAVLQQIIANNNLQVSSRPFTPILPPLMIRTDMYDAMDRLEPSDDRYKIEGEELWLQGSAEHVLGSMHAGEIFEAQNLPLRYLGYATSFRREAGTYGKDMEGIIRMHQFDKLEMESFATAETAYQEHLLLVAIQEYLMQKLHIPYQLLMKCTGDIGKPNARGVDINAWLPGQQKYRETHTADYMTDYQSRRLATRVRHENGTIELVHTNDATAFAAGRTMVAIIENYQTADGHIRVPEALRSYIGGKEVL
jgi:seryl-tRNA synthetase